MHLYFVPTIGQQAFELFYQLILIEQKIQMCTPLMTHTAARTITNNSTCSFEVRIIDCQQNVGGKTWILQEISHKATQNTSFEVDFLG